jgi:urease accessory protein
VTAEAFPGDRVHALLEAVRSGISPGHLPIAFAVAARDSGLDLAGSLAGLGFTMITSITQAAIRLGVIGQAAAARLVATSSEHLDAVVASVISGPQRRTFGAFTPALEVATLLQPTLTFRMFAS